VVGAGGRPRHQLLGRAQLGDPTSSHLPRASCRRVCQGAARTERLLAHHGAARLCFSSPHPAPVAEGCSPTSLPAFLAPPAPPHTRRFLGGSLDARLLSRCTRVAADACECRLPDLAPSQHRRRARSCARACGTADEEDPLPAATRCRAGQVAAHQPNVTTHRDAGCRTTLLVPLLVLPFIIPSHSPLRPPVPRTASPVGEVAGVWMAPSSLSCSPPALSAAQSPARAHAAPMLAAPPAQFRALPSLALHPPFCHADASAMLPRPRRALLTDWPQWTRCELVPYTRCELVPPGCIPCRLLQSHLQSCSPALERCLASSGA